MDKTFLPHRPLLEELQIALLPLTKDLATVHSMLKWAKTTIEGKDAPTNFAWMLSDGLNLSHENQVEKISSLRKSVQDLSQPLKELMRNILQFSSFKPVEKSLIALHKSYLELPAIDNEMHLLYLGTDLFESQELIEKLLTFTEKLIKLQELSAELKKNLIDSLLKNLSFSLDSDSTKSPR